MEGMFDDLPKFIVGVFIVGVLVGGVVVYGLTKIF